MLLALLNPLLDCDQLHALKLTRNDANTCISLLSDVVLVCDHPVQGHSLLTLLNILIWFSHQYHRQVLNTSKRNCSEYEKKLDYVSNELRSNVQLLVEEGVIPVLSHVLKVSIHDEIRTSAARLLWCLAHSQTVKKQMLEYPTIIEAFQGLQANTIIELKLASHCALYLLDLQIKGVYLD